MSLSKGDVRDRDAVRAWLNGAELVVHAAGQAVASQGPTDPRTFFDVNFGGTLNLLDTSREVGVNRFVLLSSTHVYGAPRYLPVDEDHPLLGVHPYAASKIAAEAAARAYGSGALATTVLRLANLYGPGQTLEAVIPTLIAQALDGHVSPRSWSPVRDFLFVDDAARAVLLALSTSRTAGAVLNISSGVGVSVADLARMIIALVQAECSRPVTRREPDAGPPPAGDVVHASSARAAEVLNWIPETTLLDGLSQTVGHARASMRPDPGV